MYTLIKLNKEQVAEFVNITSKYTSDVNVNAVGNRRAVVDGKSILGVINLDLSKPLEVRLVSNNATEIEQLETDLRSFAF